MLGSLDRWFFGRVDYALQSPYPLEESVRRVAAVVRPIPWLLQPYERGLFGRVSAARIFLVYLIPLVGNASRPCFYGRFVTNGGMVRLVGSFTQAKTIKALFILYFLFFAWFAVQMFPIGRGQAFQRGWLQFTPLLNIVLGVALNFFGRWVGAGDVPRIADALDQALS